MATYKTGLDDIRQSYRVFLGRSLEEAALLSAAVGRDLCVSVAELLSSFEFRIALLEPMSRGSALRAPVFLAPPDPGSIAWAAKRLPLAPESRSRITRASSWFEVHDAIFSDEDFRRSVRPPADLSELDAPPIPKIFPGQEAVIAKSLLFERDWYLSAYPRVAASGGDPLAHFLMHGVDEWKNPNPLFDTRWYLAKYPHVRAEGSNPLTHYVLRGAAAGYQPHPFVTPDAATDNLDGSAPYSTPLASMLAPRHRAETLERALSGPYDIDREVVALRRQAQRPEMVRHIETAVRKPLFVALVDGTGDATRTMSSISQQLYDRVKTVWSLPEAVQTLAALGDEAVYFLWLEAGDELFAEATYILFSEVARDPTASVVYADEVGTDSTGRDLPFHKPGWSPDFLESMDYIGSAACYRGQDVLPALYDAANRYDFVLRLTERQAAGIVHIPEVIVRRRLAPFGAVTAEKQASDIRALSGRLQRTNRRGTIEANVEGGGSYSIAPQLSRKPVVSIVIPTAARVISYQGRRIDLIVQCLTSILEQSTYRNIEIVVVDNGDFDRGRLAAKTRRNVKFVTYGETEVNIAKKVNLGASHASGEVILILNDDVVPIASDWIERLLAHLEKPHVGAVGAKLLYPNGTVQHAGIVMYDGLCDHVRRGEARTDLGYAFSTIGVRNYSAITGAVSMLTAEKFHLVGGYSEELPIDYNDVDLCFKLRQAGLSIVYEPKAELFHYESVSIVKPPRPQDAEHFARKWARNVYDPYYNDFAFTKFPPTFELAYSARRI